MIPPEVGPADHLLEVLGGKVRAQAVSTVAALGIADRLRAGPRPLAALAAATGCDASVLEPLLALVAGMGFFTSPEPGVYALTEHGAALCQDALGPLAAFVGAKDQWDPWSRLREAAAGGSTAFQRAHGVGLYDFLARDRAAAARYDAAIDAFTRHENTALCAHFDFAPYARVVDVGGGRGAMLGAILERWSHLSGTLFDLPHVADAARADFARRFGSRAEVVGGDFFEHLPGGADVYLLKHVLHNWDDTRATELLARCAGAMAPAGCVLVIETVRIPQDRADLASLLDLEMVVLTGGRVRRRPALRRLLGAAGLTGVRAATLTAGSWLLVGRLGRPGRREA